MKISNNMNNYFSDLINLYLCLVKNKQKQNLSNINKFQKEFVFNNLIILSLFKRKILKKELTKTEKKQGHQLNLMALNKPSDAELTYDNYFNKQLGFTYATE